MIAQYLPDRDDEIYSAYYSLKRDGKYEDHNGDLCTVRYVKDVDMEILSKYIGNINRKVYKQFDILVKNFELFLTKKVADEGLKVDFFQTVSDKILYQHVDEILEEDTDCKLNIDEIKNKLETLLVDKIINNKTVQKYIQERAYIAVDSKESDKVSNNNSSYYEIK